MTANTAQAARAKITSDVKKSFIFAKIVKITSNVRFSDSCVNISFIIRAVFLELCETERLQTTKYELQVTIGHP